MKNPYKKRREELVFFADDAFDCEESVRLIKEAGFNIERFSDHFRKEDGSREQSVKDPEVIKYCNQRGFVLLTTDGDILKRHRKEIEKARHLGILATAHNTVPDITEWSKSFLKLSILKRASFKKQPRPWFGKFDRTGKMSVPIKYVGPLQDETIGKRNAASDAV